MCLGMTLMILTPTHHIVLVLDLMINMASRGYKLHIQQNLLSNVKLSNVKSLANTVF